MRTLTAFLVVLALAAASCGGHRATSQLSTSAPSGAPSSSSTPSASSPGKTSAKSSAAPTASARALPSAAPAAGPVAAAASPPKTGTYTYDVTFNGKRSTRSTKVSNESTTSGTTKQAERAESGDTTATQHVVWQKDGKYLAETDSSQGSTQYKCDWTPDMIEYKFPLAKGAHWSQTSSCTVTFGGQKVTSKVQNDATVRGSGQVTIAGRTVKVWIIDVSIKTMSSDGTHSSSGEVKRTTQFAPEIGLAVGYTESGKTAAGTASATFELKNTNPS